MTLVLVPVTQGVARRFIADWHRHAKPPVGDLFRVGVSNGTDLVGVGVAGRPVARALNDGVTFEVTRVCTDGTPNAPSMLYAALHRAGRALGYRKAITYTLATEPGSSSLRAVGWVLDEHLDERDGWVRSERKRLFEVENPTDGKAKVRWKIDL